jgi:exonuclease VII small subunit
VNLTLKDNYGLFLMAKNGSKSILKNIIATLKMTEINNHQKPLDEAKETLDRLLGEFRTGELVGRRLRLALEHIKKQIIIAEQEQDQNMNKY